MWEMLYTGWLWESCTLPYTFSTVEFLSKIFNRKNEVAALQEF